MHVRDYEVYPVWLSERGNRFSRRFALMIVFVLYDAIRTQSKARLRRPASLVTWTVAISLCGVTSISALLLVTSFFCDFPKPIAALFGLGVTRDAPAREQAKVGPSMPHVALPPQFATLPPWTVKSGVYSTVSSPQTQGQTLPPSVEPCCLHMTIDSAKVLRDASLGRISVAQMEKLEGCVPALAGWGPLGE